MDALIVLAVLLLLLGVVVGSTAGYAIVKGPVAIAAIFGLETQPSWPRGVQEDDAPPRWKLD
jgi:hypothetical protein